MFERFTERARQVIVLAQQAAREQTSSYIGTEHVLWGLLKEEEGLAARVLESLDITDARLRAWIEAHPWSPTPPDRRPDSWNQDEEGDRVPFTPRSKKVLELALREALSLGHNYVGTEHILLGLVRENEGLAARFLEDEIGLPTTPASEMVRNEVVRMLSGPRGRKPSEKTPLLNQIHTTVEPTDRTWELRVHAPDCGQHVVLAAFKNKPEVQAGDDDGYEILGGDDDPIVIVPSGYLFSVVKCNEA